MHMHRQRRRFKRPVIVPCTHHPKFRWKIAGYYINGKRVRKFFETKGQAQTFVTSLETTAENLGTRALNIDQRLHVMALECSDKLALHGKTLADATEFLCDHLDAVERSCTLAELTRSFLEAKQQEGARRRYLKDLRNRLAYFGQTFGNRVVATITARDCDDWLRELRLAPRTRNNYRQVLSVLFNYAALRGYCSKNPVDKIGKAKVIDKSVEIFTPKQMKDLLGSASKEVRAYLAIGAFGGLRSAELSRLDWQDVHLKRRFIEVSAATSKTASRRLVTILPTLQRWLKPLQKLAGPIRPPNLQLQIKRATAKANLTKWPHNGLRHSYASYHLAKFQDAPALALQMGHRTTAMLFAHYREVVTPEAAEIYWQISA